MRPLIFDLDDTLIASFPTYVRVHQAVARELGWPVPTRAQLRAYAGGWRATLVQLFPGRDVEPFVARYDEVADHNPYPAVPGVRQALLVLRERGYPLWIITSRSERRLRQRMDEAGIDPALFRGIFPREAQPAGKPDPRCFEPVWASMGGLRDDAIYVGDRREDGRAAEAAGLAFVAVLTGPEAEAGFPDGLRPDAVLQSAAELPGWLADGSPK